MAEEGEVGHEGNQGEEMEGEEMEGGTRKAEHGERSGEGEDEVEVAEVQNLREERE